MAAEVEGVRHGMAPTYVLDAIDGIQMVYAAAEALPLTRHALSAVEGGSQEGVSEVAEPIRAAIVPHHTLIADKIGEFWMQIAASRPSPPVIVLVGPAHENQGDAEVMVTDGSWTTPFGELTSDVRLADLLIGSGAVALDRDAFGNEHSVGLHMSYLARLYPDVPVVSVIAKSTAGEAEARAFVTALKNTFPEDALVVMSVDFSHYLAGAEMDEMDAQTLELISRRDYRAMDGLQSSHVDSPFALEAYFLLGDRNQWRQELAWHENSARITENFSAPGTSYLVYLATDAPPAANYQPLTLTAAGDIMLGRGVEQALARTTIEAAFGSTAKLFSGSDFAFANLESVLTDHEPDTGKSIFFKGLPERVDVLELFGLTHVSVTNNHVDDYGKTGWADSVENVRAAGIEPVGGYGNDGEIVLWPELVEGLAEVAFLAYNDTTFRVDPDQLTADVAAAAQSAEHVIVSFHWGVEYVHIPTSRQTELAHAAIDAGADVVIGHHPHVLQGIETYGNGLILYSLGNFIFDQIGEDQNESLVARITFDELAGNSVELVPLRIQGTFPRPATDTERTQTLDRIAQWSDESLGQAIRSGKVYW